MIRTGADPSRIVPAFEGVLDAAVELVLDVSPTSSVHLYGSVATGQAVEGHSDVDLLAIGLAPAAADDLSRRLSRRFAVRCRGVEIAAAMPGDIEGDTDGAYGLRVFLRHYCVLLAGPDHRPAHDFPADVRAARGFNGDIGRHRDAWRQALTAGDDPVVLARQIARKSLLAVAGLVSVHDETWTTDRLSAARRWSEIEPEHSTGLATLLGWVDDTSSVAAVEIESALDRLVDPVVERFATDVGLWT